MREANNEALQKIKMCIKTFLNLYGTMPSAQEMIEWLGNAYEKLVPEYMDHLSLA